MAIPDNFLPTFIQLSESAYVTRVVTLAPGATIEHATDPALFVHIGRRVRLNDIVTVLAEDGSFDIDLRVTQIDPAFLWVKTRVLRMWNAPEAAAQGHRIPSSGVADAVSAVLRRPGPRRTPVRQGIDEDGYKIGWAGPTDKFRIVNTVAGAIVEKGFPTRADAIDALGRIKQAQAV